MKLTVSVAAALLVAAGLYLSSLYNYLLFHSLAEGFSILVACTIFVIAWNCRRLFENHYFLFIGIAYLFIGGLDLVHTFVYKGMNILPGYDANAPTQLWVAARYMESLTLLIATAMIRRRINTGAVFGIYGVVTVLILISVLHFGIFPDCFVENAGGLTPFKKISEYIISIILLAAGAVTVHLHSRFDPKVLQWLLLSIFFTILSELSFTAYASVYGFSNLLGHYLKIISFYLVYKAVIETGLAKPYNLLFRELEGQREWLDTTLRSIGDAVIAFDLKGEVTYMNPVASSLTGWNMQEAAGRNSGEILRTINEKTGKPAEDIVTRVLSEKRAIEMGNHTCLLTRSDDTIPIEDSASPILNEDDEIIGAVVVFHEVLEKRRAQAELRRSESRFRLLSETAGRLLTTDTPRQIVESLCSKVMAHLDCQVFFNYLVDEREDNLHMNAWAGISEEEAEKIERVDFGTAAGCGFAVREGERIIAENICRIENLGTDLVKSKGVTAYACHPLIVRGKVIGTLSFGTKLKSSFTPDELDLMKIVADQVATAMEKIRLIEDLEKSRKELERRVRDRTAELRRRADQLARLASELTLAEERERRRLAGILHDELQQWLVAAKVRLEVLSNGAAAEERKNAENILNHILQSIKIVRSMTAELSPPLLHRGGLSAALKWLGRWMQDVHGLSVELSADPRLDPKQEDYTVLLFQSVRELLFNTVKHAGVSAARVDMYEDGNGWRRIVVSDGGAGFDAEKIWESAAANNGFGLFGIRERLMLMGGRFEVKSEPGKGSAFSLIVPPEHALKAMPETPAAAAAEVPGRAVPAIAGEKIRVMLVDDHEMVRNGLSTLLGNNTDIAVVAESSDGEEALRRAEEVLPDVILMDVNMPKMDGLEATRRIHARFAGIRVIVLSMYEDGEIAAEAINAGASAYLSKSGSTGKLLAAIRGVEAAS